MNENFNWGSSLNFGPDALTAPSWNVPSISDGGNAASAASAVPAQGLEFGMNIPTFQLGLQGLGALGNIWGAFQTNRLARDSLNFTKKMAETNLANQVKSYNTALVDRANSRGVVQGDSQEKTQQYINDNKL